MSAASIAPLTVLAVFALTADPACASQTPLPGRADARVQEIDYDPQQVVRVTSQYRTATQIVFGERESILHAAIGDASGWDVVAENNILFLKPKAAHGQTNLIVTTATPAGARSYTFELVIPKRTQRSTVFVLRFRYPSDAKAQASLAISARERELTDKLTALQLEHGVAEGKRNLAYEVQGATELQPSEVSDNGRFTILRFPGTQSIPSIFQVAPDGTESLVPFDVRGEFVVIHGTAKQFRLRRGRLLLCIYNTAPDPYGSDLGTKTASSHIQRQDVGPAQKSAPGGGQP